jgi:hypothetical protein
MELQFKKHNDKIISIINDTSDYYLVEYKENNIRMRIF